MFTLQENWAIYFSAFIVIFFVLKAAQGYNTGILRRLIGLVGSIISYWMLGYYAVYLQNTLRLFQVNFLAYQDRHLRKLRKPMLIR